MKKVLLLLAKGFEIYEASVFIDVLGWSSVEGDTPTKVITCGFSREVRTTFNHRMIVDLLIDEIDGDEYDALAIPGGFEEYGFYEDAYSKAFLDIIQGFRKRNKLIASICVAALPLGKSGILEGRKATTYCSRVRREALKSFGAEVVDQQVVIDDNIITSCNPASAIDVAFLLLERITTRDNAENVRLAMGFQKKGKG